MEDTDMQKSNSNPKNQPATYIIRRSVRGDKLQTLKEMSSKKRAKVNDSGVKNRKKNMIQMNQWRICCLFQL